MNIRGTSVCVDVSLPLLLGRYRRSELPVHMVFCVSRTETAKLFSKQLHCTFSPAVRERSDFSTSAASPCFCFFYSDHPSECEVVPGCGLDLCP